MSPSRRSRLPVLLLLATVLLLATAGTAAAQEVRSGDTVVIPAGTTIHHDLTVLGGTVDVRGNVDGNLVVAGGTVIVGGNVTGTTTIAGGTVTLDGHLHRDVQVAAGSLTLGRHAVLDQNLRYNAGTFQRDPAAVVHGTVSREASMTFGPNLGDGVVTAWGLALNLVIGAVLLAVFPGFTETVVGTGRREPVRSGGVGLLALVAIPVGLVLLAITIVGIPLAIVGLVLYGLLLWTGFVLGGYLAGRWILARTNVDNRWGALVLGLVLLAVVGFVPVLGGIANFLLLLLGLGGLVLALVAGYRARRARARGAGQAEAPDAPPASTTEPRASPAGEAPADDA